MNTQTLRINWFLLVAPVVIAADLYLGLSARGGVDKLVEAGLLFDLVVLIPCLYWLCYRQRGQKRPEGNHPNRSACAPRNLGCVEAGSGARSSFPQLRCATSVYWARSAGMA